MAPRRAALVSAREALSRDLDLPLAVDALARRGVDAEIVLWDDPAVAWSRFDVIVVRSPWDYAPQRDRFVAWAERVASAAPLYNPPELLRWNTDKRYLRELGAAGVPIIETCWLEPGDAPRWPALDDFVVKPTISAGARDTARYGGDAASVAEAEAHAARLLAAGRGVMVQRYQASVDARGERALLYFDGVASHAVSKGALLRRGERVHHEGPADLDLAPATPSEAERAVAERVLAAIPGGTAPLYARVDLVDGDDGAPRLLELEITEPSLFLTQDAGAADRFAGAVVRRM